MAAMALMAPVNFPACCQQFKLCFQLKHIQEEYNSERFHAHIKRLLAPLLCLNVQHIVYSAFLRLLYEFKAKKRSTVIFGVKTYCLEGTTDRVTQLL